MNWQRSLNHFRPDAASDAIDGALKQNALVERAVDDKLEFGSAGR